MVLSANSSVCFHFLSLLDQRKTTQPLQKKPLVTIHPVQEEDRKEKSWKNTQVRDPKATMARLLQKMKTCQSKNAKIRQTKA